MDDIFRFPAAAIHEPAIDAWLKTLRKNLQPLAEPWIAHMRRLGSDVRELMHDGCPTASVGDCLRLRKRPQPPRQRGFFFGALLPDPVHLLEGTGIWPSGLTGLIGHIILSAQTK